MFSALLLPFILLVATLLLLGGSGNFLLLLVGHKSGIYSRIFSSLLLSLLLFTCSFALWTCGMKSVFSLLLFFFAVWLWLMGVKVEGSNFFTFNLHLKGQGKLVFSLLLLAFVVYFWSWIHFPNSNEMPANPESLLYARFAKLIGFSGIESTFGIGSLPDAIPSALSPYHYFDIWLCAGLSQIFGYSELACWHYFVLPIFGFLIGTGLIALLETFVKPQLPAIIATIALLFLSSLPFLPPLKNFGAYHFDSLEGPLQLYGEKLSFAYVIVLQSLLLYRSGKLQSAMCMLAFLPYFFPTLLFPMALALPFLTFFCWRFRYLSLRQSLSFIAFLLAANLALAGWYQVFGITVIAVSEVTDFRAWDIESLKFFFAEAYYRAYAKPLRSLIFYALPALLLLLNRKTMQQTALLQGLLVLVLIIYVAALTSWAIFYKLPEAWQIYTNSLVFVHVLEWLLIIHLLANQKDLRAKLSLVLVGSISIVSAISQYFEYNASAKKYSYSPSFLKQVLPISNQQEKNYCVAYVQSPDDLVSNMELYTGGLTGSYLQLSPNFFGSCNIGQLAFLKDAASAKNYERAFGRQAFYQLLQQQTNPAKMLDAANLQLNFMHQHQLRIIVYSAHANPAWEVLKQSEKLLVDWRSGEKFLLLKKKFTFKKI